MTVANALFQHWLADDNELKLDPFEKHMFGCLSSLTSSVKNLNLALQHYTMASYRTSLSQNIPSHSDQARRAASRDTMVCFKPLSDKRWWPVVSAEKPGTGMFVRCEGTTH